MQLYMDGPDFIFLVRDSSQSPPVYYLIEKVSFNTNGSISMANEYRIDLKVSPLTPSPSMVY